MTQQINVQDIGEFLIKYCFNNQVKTFTFKRKDSKSKSYKATILLLDNTSHKLLLQPCDQCGGLAVFTEEGPNAEYAQELCRKCEAGED